MPAGRPAKTTALRLVEGVRGHRPLPKGEPQPRVGVPSIPPDVSADIDAARHWRATARILGAVAGWVTHDMTRQLSDYALLRARKDRLVAYLRENGETYESEYIHKDEDDREVLVKKRSRHPETVILKEVLGELRQLEVAMGIGPVYRTKIDLSAGQDGQNDDLDS